MKTFNSFTVAMLDFFGRLPNQDLKAFSDECKALSEADKKWFAEQLAAQGVQIAAMPVAA